ncbi:PIG-L family deacetylase [bacterium]|mgnify:CR=1 FL=1|jgi:N-acetylglucosamine malate deacetylase 1|nr:PIG-L family deacetylase [bacterium]
MNENVLIVAAHPDDEVLGCGGVIAKHIDDNDNVSVVFMADGVESRNYQDFESNISDRKTHALKACSILGVNNPIFLNFPDNRMDSIPLLDVIKSIEKIIDKLSPTIIYTHNDSDLNIDHRITYQAVMTSCRPQQGSSIKKIYLFEVLSSTEWSLSSYGSFVPNCFVDITNFIDVKIDALNEYLYEINEFPHPRSVEAVKALAKIRGSSSGFMYAEAFKVERDIVS